MLATSQPMSQLQAFQAIQPSYTLHVHGPTFALQQNVDASISVTRTRLSELAQPMPQPFLARSAAAILE